MTSALAHRCPLPDRCCSHLRDLGARHLLARVLLHIDELACVQGCMLFPGWLDQHTDLVAQVSPAQVGSPGQAQVG